MRLTILFLALENFKAGLYDLVILDIKMPKMNGFELFREIKKIDNNVKVCFLTALNELHDYEPFRKEVFPKNQVKDILFKSQSKVKK